MYLVKDVFISSEEAPVLSKLHVSRLDRCAHFRQSLFQPLNVTIMYFSPWMSKITPLHPEKNTFLGI